MIQVTHVNIRKSISLLVSRLIVLYIMVSVASLFLYIPEELLHTYFDFDIRRYVIISSILLNLTQLIMAIWIVVDWLCDYYEIETDRIVFRKGIFFHHEKQYFTKNITAVDCHESFFGEIFNFGTIHLYDFPNNKHVFLTLIHNPKRCFEIIKEVLPERNMSTEFLARPLIYDNDKSV